jgi:hypothetical protein
MDEADVAQEVNARIRDLARHFEAGRELPVAFLCECGCFAFVPLTIDDYDALDGPVTATVHRLQAPGGPPPGA